MGSSLCVPTKSCKCFATPLCRPISRFALCHLQFEGQWRQQYAGVIEEQRQLDAALAERKAAAAAAAQAAAAERAAAEAIARQAAPASLPAAAAVAAHPLLAQMQQQQQAAMSAAGGGQANMLPLGFMQQMMAMQQAMPMVPRPAGQ